MPSVFSSAVKTVAAYEAAKGAVALVFAAVLFAGRNRVPQTMAWLDKDWHRIFGSALSVQLERFNALADTAAHHAVLPAAAAASYALLRFAEAYGLWRGRSWGYWFSLLGYGLFLPLEFYTLLSRPFSLLHLGVIVLNLLIMGAVYRSMRDRGLIGSGKS